MSKNKTTFILTILCLIVTGCFAIQYASGISVQSPINMNFRSITNLGTSGGDYEAVNGSYLRSSLQPIYIQLGSVLTTGNDYGRSGVSTDLYEGTTALYNKYLGITDKAADADKLDGNDSPDFQRRVSGTCSSGSSMRVIYSDGTVSCETDDLGVTADTDCGRSGACNTLYEGTTALPDKYLGTTDKAADADRLYCWATECDSTDFVNKTGKAADADKLDGNDSPDFQRRVSGTCSSGSSMRVIYSDGTVSCETFLTASGDYGRYGVASTLYEGRDTLASTYLGKTDKAADADKLDSYNYDYFQRRVSGSCSSGSAIRIIYSDGTVGCQTLAALWRESPLASNDTYYIGNVAIGKSHPNYSLDIAGTLAVSGTKNFVIDHPIKENTKLIHSTLEGPEAAVFYRGEAQLTNGEAVVELPEYFEALTRKEGRTVLLTPKSESKELVSHLAVFPVKNGKFKVKAIDNNNPEQKFFWEVKAIRADMPPLEVEIKPENKND